MKKHHRVFSKADTNIFKFHLPVLSSQCTLDIRASVKYPLSDPMRGQSNSRHHHGQSMCIESTPATTITVRTGHPIKRVAPMLGHHRTNCISNTNKIKYRPISYNSSSTNTNQNDLIENGLIANKENVPTNGKNGQMKHHIGALKVIHQFNVFSVWKQDQGRTAQWKKEANECYLQIRQNRLNGERVILCEERSTRKVVLLHRYPTRAHLMALKRGCAVCWRCEQENNLIRCDFHSKLKAWPFLHVLLGMDS